MSTFVCVCVLVEEQSQVALGRASGWLQCFRLRWSVLPHTLIISVSVFPAASPFTKHRHASPQSHEYVR